MTEKKNIVQILPRESIIASIVKDTYSICVLIGLFYFNQHYIGGSYVVNFLVLFGLIIYATKLSKNSVIRASDEQIQQIKTILNNDKSN